LNAKNAFEQYFAKVKPEEIGPLDYKTYGLLLLKFPGNEAKAADILNKAIAMDTLEKDKVDLINSIASSYIAAKNYCQAGNWYTRVIGVKKNVTKTDLYNAGYNGYFKGSCYQSADSVFKLWQAKYPDDILPVYLDALALAYIDSTGAQGLAKPAYDKVITMAVVSQDTVRSKQYLITAYTYMVAYYYKQNDFTQALEYVDKVLALDPTNANMLENRKALASAIANKTKTKGEKEKVKTDSTKEKSTPAKTKVKGK